MSIYLFARFLFNPKLLLTDLRSEYGGYLSILAAALAVSTLSLSNDIIFYESQGITHWIASSAGNFILLVALGMIYLPMIHLFAEKNMPGARISDLFVYSGFILSPLFFSLPAALIIFAFNLTPIVYQLIVLLIILKIFHNVVNGVKDNYRLSIKSAVQISFTPLILVSFFALLLYILL